MLACRPLKLATYCALAIEQLTLLVKESEGGRDLERGDVRSLLKVAIDIIVQCKRIDRRFRVNEIYFEP